MIDSTAASPDPTVAPLPPGRAARAQAVALAAVVAGLLALPLGLRLVNRLAPPTTDTPSYLPAIEVSRTRQMAFDGKVVVGLQRLGAEFVVIGDSMVGSRLDPWYLSSLLDDRGVAPIYYAATGSAFWYLALKNWVVASQTRPRRVIVFFRDDNLTDPMFRVTGVYRATLDRAARDREPVLNDILAMHTQGARFRVHAFADGIYRHEEVRTWLEPWLVEAPTALAARGKARRTLLERMNAEVFGLEALRRMAPADVAQADEAAFDFQRNLPRSVLPEMIKVASRGGFRLGFVRVQRRPEGNRPPVQSPALQRYVRDLKAYLAANGALFVDEWGDADQPLSIYTDGDHVGSQFRRHYTEQFLRKHPALFR